MSEPRGQDAGGVARLDNLGGFKWFHGSNIGTCASARTDMRMHPRAEAFDLPAGSCVGSLQPASHIAARARVAARHNYDLIGKFRRRNFKALCALSPRQNINKD
jgi:hypothetical protein